MHKRLFNNPAVQIIQTILMKENVPSQLPFLRQYVFEQECWHRLLAYFKEELVSCKNRLSDLVLESQGDQSLLIAEGFQEDFISLDLMIRFLEGEWKKQSKLLEKECCNDDEMLCEVIKGHTKLRGEIQKAEAIFRQVKDKFNCYLHELY
jgi:hypothetical protein